MNNSKKVNRQFKGIWVDRKIWLASGLNITEKMFIAEIDSFTGNGRTCFASNNHFANWSGLTSSRCSQIISKLADKGFINVELIYDKEGKGIDKRIITINYERLNDLEALETGYLDSDVPTKNTKGGTKNTKGGTKYTKEGYLEYCEGTNTSTTNTLTNTSTKDIVVSKETDDKVPYKEVIEYLNNKTEKNYRNVETNKKLIRARFNEGYTLKDFEYVIDVKTSQWKDDDKMSKFLRPSTLFGTKFDNYLNEEIVVAKEEKDYNGMKTKTESKFPTFEEFLKQKEEKQNG